MDLIDKQISELVVEKSRNRNKIIILTADLKCSNERTKYLEEQLSKWGQLKKTFETLK